MPPQNVLVLFPPLSLKYHRQKILSIFWVLVFGVLLGFFVGFSLCCFSFCFVLFCFNLEPCFNYCVVSCDWILSTHGWNCMLTFQNIPGKNKKGSSKGKIILSWVHVLKRDEVPETLLEIFDFPSTHSGFGVSFVWHT